MPTIEDSSLTIKEPSIELLKLIEDLKVNLLKAKDLFILIVNKARDEGFDDKEIDILLHSNLKEIIPKTTLLRYRKEFIPIGVNKRSNVSNDTLMNVTEQSSVISGPLGPTNTKISTLPEDNLIPTSNNNNQLPIKELETTKNNDEISPLNITEVSKQEVPQIDSNSLRNEIEQIELAQVEKWRYESEDEHHKRVRHFCEWVDSSTPKELEVFKNLSYEDKISWERLIGSGMYHKQYYNKLEQFFIKWQEMKKLYVELIEFDCKCNSNYGIWLSEIISNIQDNLRTYHNFSFPDALSRYVSQHFIDKKTQEYLIKKYGNEVNQNLGFEEWERELMKTPNESKLEKQKMLQEFRKDMAKKLNKKDDQDDDF